MTGFSTIGPRLAKILPLLGSDQPGEVTAAAAGLRRILKSAGLDLNDLSALVAAEVERRGKPAFSFAGLGPRGARKQLAMLMHREELTAADRAEARYLYDRLHDRRSGFRLAGDAVTRMDALWRRSFGGGA